ncbi:MAG: DUF1127 domain-containing protein [Pseudomonadota bacterium]|nr:DUF1127 domain-containing protein [Pseudomonadota bacterium]
MTTTTFGGLPDAGQGLGILGRMASALAAYWSAYRARQERRASEALLRSLDDRTLKDIGIDRSEIGSLFGSDTGDRVLSRRVQPRQMRHF